MTTSDGTRSRRPPRGRLEHVPPAVRHLWSLLYRATRRHADRVDRLTGSVAALARGLDQLRNFTRSSTVAHRRDLDQLHRRAHDIEDRLTDLAVMLGDALRDADEREDRARALRVRVDALEAHEEDASGVG